MPRRPVLTLILLTPQRVYRADFTRAGRPPEVTDVERPHGPDVTAAVEAAVYSAMTLGKAVYVFATDFWIQSVEQSANRVSGLTDAEIAQALNFEAEVLSGLPAVEAAVAVQALPPTSAEKRFLLLQVKSADRDAITHLLQTRGSKLGGLLHPAALPRAFGADEFQARVELWADAVAGVRPIDGGVDIAVSNADPQTNRWQVDLADWSRLPTFTGPGVRAPAGTDPVKLDKLDILSSWFSAWAAELTSRRPRAAIVRPAPLPASLGLKLLMAVACLGLAAGAVYLHWTSYSHQLTELRAHTSAAAEKTKQLADLEARTKAQRKELDAAAEELTRLDRLTQEVKNWQSRYASLLEVLAKQKPAEAMICRIETDNGEPKLFGMAQRPELVDEYVHALAAKVRPLGWELRPPHKTAQKLAADGGPWAFEISFSPVIQAAPAPAVTAKGGTLR